jgi:hypothetical protein
MTINTANMYVTESNNEMAGTPQQYKPITVGPAWLTNITNYNRKIYEQ